MVKDKLKVNKGTTGKGSSRGASKSTSKATSKRQSLAADTAAGPGAEDKAGVKKKGSGKNVKRNAADEKDAEEADAVAAVFAELEMSDTELEAGQQQEADHGGGGGGQLKPPPGGGVKGRGSSNPRRSSNAAGGGGGGKKKGGGKNRSNSKSSAPAATLTDKEKEEAAAAEALFAELEAADDSTAAAAAVASAAAPAPARSSKKKGKARAASNAAKADTDTSAASAAAAEAAAAEAMFAELEAVDEVGDGVGAAGLPSTAAASATAQSALANYTTQRPPGFELPVITDGATGSTASSTAGGGGAATAGTSGAVGPSSPRKQPSAPLVHHYTYEQGEKQAAHSYTSDLLFSEMDGKSVLQALQEFFPEMPSDVLEDAADRAFGDVNRAVALVNNRRAEPLLPDTDDEDEDQDNGKRKQRQQQQQTLAGLAENTMRSYKLPLPPTGVPNAGGGAAAVTRVPLHSVTIEGHERRRDRDGSEFTGYRLRPLRMGPQGGGVAPVWRRFARFAALADRIRRERGRDLPMPPKLLLNDSDPAIAAQRMPQLQQFLNMCISDPDSGVSLLLDQWLEGGDDGTTSGSTGSGGANDDDDGETAGRRRATPLSLLSPRRNRGGHSGSDAGGGGDGQGGGGDGQGGGGGGGASGGGGGDGSGDGGKQGKAGGKKRERPRSQKTIEGFEESDLNQLRALLVSRDETEPEFIDFFDTVHPKTGKPVRRVLVITQHRVFLLKMGALKEVKAEGHLIELGKVASPHPRALSLEFKTGMVLAGETAGAAQEAVDAVRRLEDLLFPGREKGQKIVLEVVPKTRVRPLRPTPHGPCGGFPEAFRAMLNYNRSVLPAVPADHRFHRGGDGAAVPDAQAAWASDERALLQVVEQSLEPAGVVHFDFRTVGLRTDHAPGERARGSQLCVQSALLALVHNLYFRGLLVTDYRMDRDSMGVLAFCLKYNGCFDTVVLNGVACGLPRPVAGECMEAVLDSLVANPRLFSLTSLDLSHNVWLGRQGALLLAEFLSHCRALRRLSVAHSGLHGVWLGAVLKALVRNGPVSARLTLLDLSGCLVTAAAANLLGQLLAGLRAVHSLLLNGCFVPALAAHAAQQDIDETARQAAELSQRADELAQERDASRGGGRRRRGPSRGGTGGTGGGNATGGGGGGDDGGGGPVSSTDVKHALADAADARVLANAAAAAAASTTVTSSFLADVLDALGGAAPAQLRRLHLTDCVFRARPDAAALERCLARLPALAELDLARCDLSPATLRVCLQSCSGAVSLRMCALDTMSASLAAGVKLRPHIRALDLAGNPLGAAGISALADAFAAQIPSGAAAVLGDAAVTGQLHGLRVLRLSGCFAQVSASSLPKSDGGSNQAEQQLHQQHQAPPPPPLSHLVLGTKGDHHPAFFDQQLPVDVQRARDRAIGQLIRFLCAPGCRLHTLALAGTAAEAGSAPPAPLGTALLPLLRALPRMASLRTLDLSDNLAGNEGAMVLGAVLLTNPPLAQLAFDGNGTDAAGFRALEHGLRRNQTLTRFPLPARDAAAALHAESLALHHGKSSSSSKGMMSSFMSKSSSSRGFDQQQHAAVDEAVHRGYLPLGFGDPLGHALAPVLAAVQAHVARNAADAAEAWKQVHEYNVQQQQLQEQQSSDADVLLSAAVSSADASAAGRRTVSTGKLQSSSSSLSPNTDNKNSNGSSSRRHTLSPRPANNDSLNASSNNRNSSKKKSSSKRKADAATEKEVAPESEATATAAATTTTDEEGGGGDGGGDDVDDDDDYDFEYATPGGLTDDASNAYGDYDGDMWVSSPAGAGDAQWFFRAAAHAVNPSAATSAAAAATAATAAASAATASSAAGRVRARTLNELAGSRDEFGGGDMMGSGDVGGGGKDLLDTAQQQQQQQLLLSPRGGAGGAAGVSLRGGGAAEKWAALAASVPAFGQPLTRLVRPGPRGHLELPSWLSGIIVSLEKFHVKSKDLFAAPADPRKTQALIRDLDRGPIEWATVPAPLITAALMAFLRQLPEPVFTSELVHQFAKAAKKESAYDRRIELYKRLLRRLPPAPQYFVSTMFRLLARVAANAADNGMTSARLGATLAPALMFDPTDRGRIVAGAAKTIQFLIENRELVFVPGAGLKEAAAAY